MILKKFEEWYLGEEKFAIDNAIAYYYVGHRSDDTVPCGDRLFFGFEDSSGLKEGCNHCQTPWPYGLKATLVTLLKTM